MDIFAGDRPFRVADERSDRDFGETKIIGHAGEAVPQHVRRHIPEGRVLEELLPAWGKLPTALSMSWPGKT